MRFTTGLVSPLLAAATTVTASPVAAALAARLPPVPSCTDVPCWVTSAVNTSLTTVDTLAAALDAQGLAAVTVSSVISAFDTATTSLAQSEANLTALVASDGAAAAASVLTDLATGEVAIWLGFITDVVADIADFIPVATYDFVQVKSNLLNIVGSINTTLSISP